MKNRFTHVTVHIHPLCAESYALCSVFLAVGGFKQCNKKWCQQVCLMYVFLPIIVSLQDMFSACHRLLQILNDSLYSAPQKADIPQGKLEEKGALFHTLWK